jgi:hypothetical protein
LLEKCIFSGCKEKFGQNYFDNEKLLRGLCRYHSPDLINLAITILSYYNLTTYNLSECASLISNISCYDPNTYKNLLYLNLDAEDEDYEI